jgi:hypothetical protein
MKKWIIDKYCGFLCWLMDHSDSDGLFHHAVIWIAEHTTPADW